MIFPGGVGLGDFLGALSRLVVMTPSGMDPDLLLATPMQDLMAAPEPAAKEKAPRAAAKEAAWSILGGFSKVSRFTSSILFSGDPNPPAVTPAPAPRGAPGRGGGAGALAAAHELNLASGLSSTSSQSSQQGSSGGGGAGASGSPLSGPSSTDFIDLKALLNWPVVEEERSQWRGGGNGGPGAGVTADGVGVGAAQSGEGAAASSPAAAVLPSAASLEDPAMAPPPHREPPLGPGEVAGLKDEAGRVTNPSLLRRRAFYGSLEAEVRAEVWGFFLGVYAYDSTAEERAAVRSERAQSYQTIKAMWTNMSDAQEGHWAELRDRKHRIEKDVLRTDRSFSFFAGPNPNPNVKLLYDILVTFSLYNYDAGYVQGMSDLLSPMLVVVGGDEAEAFWYFVHLMDKVESNFHRDQAGIFRQLSFLKGMVRITDPELYSYLELKAKDSMNFFFTFRWVLLFFKREYEFEDVLGLWDSLFSRYYSAYFHLFVAAGILSRARRDIINNRMGFDDLVRLANAQETIPDVNDALAMGEKVLYDVILFFDSEKK
jgi:hypothetical protein